MKDYKVIVTETKIVEVTATAPSAEIALEMVTTLKTKTPLIDNAPNAETVTLYSVFAKESDDNDEEESEMDETTCSAKCPHCPLSNDCDDEDEGILIDEIC